MTTKHLVDPELLAGLDKLPVFDLSPATLAGVRTSMNTFFRELSATVPPIPEIARSERTIPGPKGAPDIRVLIYRPRADAAPRPAYLHIHGGGYVLGSADMSDAGNVLLAQALDCVVVSVDYRIAPETVFPGAVEDCHAALKWLYTNAAELGVDKTRIATGGESAGGGLAAGLALLARDRGEVPLIHQQLIYPMIDDRTTGGRNPYTGEYVWTDGANQFGWASILGRAPGGADTSPYAAASRAKDVAGLPSTFISCGALDLFLDEDLDYAQRLIRAGVPTEVHIYPGAYHGFDLVATATVSKTHARDKLDALRRAFKIEAKRK